MTYEVIRRARSGRVSDANMARLYPGSGQMLVPAGLLHKAGIDRHVRVLWDARARRIALESANPDDDDAVTLTARPGRRQFAMSSKNLFDAVGLASVRACRARVEDGMVVVDVGAPDAEEAAA